MQLELNGTMVWEKCLRFIRTQVADQSFKTWFEPIKAVKLKQNVLTLEVPSQFFFEWLEEHYVHLLKRAISQQLGPEAKLEYSVVVDGGDALNKPTTINLPTSRNSSSRKRESHLDKYAEYQSPFVIRTLDNLHLAANLKDEYTFDTFIEGDCNRLARSAGMAAAEKPGRTAFNPLVFYGGVGLGKTHLVQAIGNHIKREQPEKFVLYVSSEKFTSQFIEALKKNKVQEFTNFYLQVSVLIIDDIQFLSGKEKTQEIFFQIFNHLHLNENQIIMTSDKAPSELKGLQERLLSRFKWGLTADLQVPDFETRIAIIQTKLETDGICIPNDVMEYLAYSVESNVRELEGVIISLIAHASLIKKEIDLELAKQVLKKIVKDIDMEVGMDYIQKTVSKFFRVPISDMVSKSRKKEIVIARQVAMHLAKQHTDQSLKSIGQDFGGRDHSTVIHAIQSVNDMIDTNARFRESMDELFKKFKLRTRR